MLILKCLSTFAAFYVINCAPSNIDKGQTCVIRNLKAKGKLEADFPEPKYVDPETCRMVNELVANPIVEGFQITLSQKASIKSHCVTEEIKANGGIDYMGVKSIVDVVEGITEDVREQKLEEVNKKLKKIFEDAAKKCDSDPTYAGLFDEILGIKNETFAVLSFNYCTNKFLIDNNFLDEKTVDLSTNSIDTENLDCTPIIDEKRKAEEKTVRDALKSKIPRGRKLNCMMESYRSNKIFENTLALEVVERLDVTLDVKRDIKDKVTGKLQDYMRSSIMCAFAK